jgi:hypothetical protein
MLRRVWILLALSWPCSVFLLHGTLAFGTTELRLYQRHDMYHIAKNQYASKWAMSASSEDGMWQNAPAIEGLMNQVEFDRLDAVDATIQALCKQLPTILTKPLTAQSAEEVYCGDSFRLIVHVDDVETNDNSEDIVVLRGQNDLIALSDVLVLATAAAQQANAAISGGVADTAIDVQLQVILDGSYEVLRFTKQQPI